MDMPVVDVFVSRVLSFTLVDGRQEQWYIHDCVGSRLHWERQLTTQKDRHQWYPFECIPETWEELAFAGAVAQDG